MAIFIRDHHGLHVRMYNILCNQQDALVDTYTCQSVMHRLFDYLIYYFVRKVTTNITILHHIIKKKLYSKS